MHEDIDRVILHHDRIRQRVAEMGAAIAETYAPLAPRSGLTLVPVLAGSIIFLADLIRELPVKMKIALVQLSAYRGKTTQPGDARTVMSLSGDVTGRHVLIIDDILDSGRTLRHVQDMVRQHEPASLRTAVLLRKPSKAPPDVNADFVGFDIEDEFVVGYGLDYDDLYRNYPHLAVLRADVLR